MRAFDFSSSFHNNKIQKTEEDKEEDEDEVEKEMTTTIVVGRKKPPPKRRRRRGRCVFLGEHHAQHHHHHHQRRRRQRGVLKIPLKVFLCAFCVCVFVSAFFFGAAAAAAAAAFGGENNATSTLVARERTSAANLNAGNFTRMNNNNNDAGPRRENVSSSTTTRMREDGSIDSSSSNVRTRPDVDAAFLYRISGDMVARMRARMPRELVEKGDPVAEARYASARCEDSSGGGGALNFIFDFFDALLEAFSFRTYDKQMNRMYQMHSRTNRSVGNEDGDSNDIAAISTREAGDEAIPMINIEDAFYTRAKSF